MPAFVDLTGQSFGRLTVIRLDARRRGRHLYWQCLCICGKEVIVAGGHLRSRHTVSCGCAHFLPADETAFREVFRCYQLNAKQHDRRFTLTAEQFRKITSSVCFYCGVVPSKEQKARTGNGRSYLYNGIDRTDNSQGYTLENSVACCQTCNYMKRDLSQNDFLEHVSRICGERVPKRLSDREHVCTACGLVASRDHVSAQVILQRAGILPSNANVGEVMPCVV